ncbi:hypothetical protein VRRI112168_20205 [Vreelandella rituensis]
MTFKENRLRYLGLVADSNLVTEKSRSAVAGL